MQGVVKWFDNKKGYGFLKPDGQTNDIFVHYSAIEGGGFRELADGQRVTFETEQGQKGLQACNVKAAV